MLKKEHNMAQPSKQLAFYPGGFNHHRPWGLKEFTTKWFLPSLVPLDFHHQRLRPVHKDSRTGYKDIFSWPTIKTSRMRHCSTIHRQKVLPIEPGYIVFAHLAGHS